MQETEFLEQSKVKSMHYAYMVRCADNTIYSGYSTDPINREMVHNSGKGAKYTRNRLPVKLIHVEIFENKSDAQRAFDSYKGSFQGGGVCELINWLHFKSKVYGYL